MFGAKPLKCSACAATRTGSRKNFGLVWIDSRPLRPPSRSNTGSSSVDARTAISSISCQAMSSSVDVGFWAMISAIRSRHRCISLLSTSPTIVGLLVAPTAPRSTAYVSSSIEHESFQ